MSRDGLTEVRGGFWASAVSLFASSSTLVCCAIPALLVALGAGAALSSLIAVFPQVVWLSEHKVALFAFAGTMLLFGGVLQWRSKMAPCPTDLALRDICLRTRKMSLRLYGLSVLLLCVGGWFAFVQPLLSHSTSAQEQGVQLPDTELAPGGAAMVALVRAFGGLHLAQQGVHFL
jgi:hypothetical protein